MYGLLLQVRMKSRIELDFIDQILLPMISGTVEMEQTTPVGQYLTVITMRWTTAAPSSTTNQKGGQ